MGVIIPGDFKVVHIKRFFALNVFVLTRFHCICWVSSMYTNVDEPMYSKVYTEVFSNG